MGDGLCSLKWYDGVRREVKRNMKKGVEGEKKKNEGEGGSGSSSFWTIFMHADAVDVWLMAIGFLAAACDGLVTPAVLVVTGKLMNNLGNNPSSTSMSTTFINDINKNVMIFVYVACVSFVASFLEGYCWARTAERQASRMRARYLRAVLRQDVEYFDLRSSSTADVITGVSSDTSVIQEVLSEKVPHFIMTSSIFIGSYAAGFFQMWRLAAVAFPTVVLLVIPGLIYGRMLMGISRKIRAEHSKSGAVAQQAVSTVRTVYSFTGEGRTMADYSASLDGSVRLGLRQGLAKGVAIGSNGVTFAIWAFMVWYGSRLVMYHGGEGGTVFAVGLSIVAGGLALGSGLANVRYFLEARSAAERIMEVMKRVPRIDSESEEGEVIEGVVGEVEFRGVEFAYPSRPENPVFRGFELKVPAGKTVALVGGSGSGKSTVIALLERFYDPAGGEILLDGVDIRRLRVKWLRSQMGLVSQEPALFATSIKENILFGKEDATMEEVVAAAKAANAHNFISELPQGYDTQVGERGVQMSGGQKQRIAIARAVLKSPKILLLDEATSALDSESEQIVQQALDLASLGRTTIVIAHRLSTIRDADIIAVVQSGEVIESGSHDDLIRDADGHYSSLLHLQHTAPLSGEDEVISRGFPEVRSPRSSNTAVNQTESIAPQPDLDPEPPAPSLRRLLLLNAPEWKQAVVGSVTAAVAGAVQPLYAFAMGDMISVYFLKDHQEIKAKTATLSLVFTALSVISFLSNVGQHYSLGAMGEYLTKRVRERMMSKILTFEVGWFDRDENSTGAICSRLVRNANVVRSLVGDRMALLIQTFSAVIIACAFGLVIAWRLALVMIAVQPIIIICFYIRRVVLNRTSGKAVKAQSESSKLAAEAVSNLRTVTAFSSQDRILRLFDLAQDSPRRESIRQSWFAGGGLGLAQGLMNLTWALDFWYGGRLFADGYITGKALFQTYLILIGTGRSIADAGRMTTDLAKGADTVRSVFAVLDRRTRIDPDDPVGFRPEKLTGGVEIQGVDFAYPARPNVLVLRGFSLSIEAGRSTALVGRTGSGKSTVIGLIERFYDPIRGSVEIDGRDVRAYHLRSLRRHIALVGQEPALFSGSVMENIAYGAAGGATEAEVVAAAQAANAHGFIGGLKDGYGTQCGDRGVQLSGGQKQRIAIARAILRDPAILLLDEATSALDGGAERAVQEALERVMVGRTTVVVAHRLTTIQNCHVIVVMEDGAVVEKGTHSALLAKGDVGAYNRLVSLQLAHS